MVCFVPDTHVYQQLIAAGGGLLGGLSMLVYMRPHNVADGLRRVVVSTVAAALLATLVAEKVFGGKEPELLASAAFLIGFSAWSILGATARFFENRKDDDIVGMMKSYNEVSRPSYGGYTRPEPTPRHNQIDNPDA